MGVGRDERETGHGMKRRIFAGREKREVCRLACLQVFGFPTNGRPESLLGDVDFANLVHSIHVCFISLIIGL